MSKVEKTETRGRTRRGEEKCLSKSISLTPQEFEDMQSKAKFMGFKDLSSYLRFTHEFFTKHAMNEFKKAE